MAFDPKDWVTETTPTGDPADPDVATPIDGAALIDMETRLSDYTDAALSSADAVVYKGAIDCSANPNYPAADAGHLYRVSVAGKIGGASGLNVEIGDTLLCAVDSTAAGTQAEVGANWNVIQANLDGAVIGPSSATDGHLAQFDGTTGKLIKGGLSLDTDGTLAANSDTKLGSQKATKTYADAAKDAAIAAVAGQWRQAIDWRGAQITDATSASLAIFRPNALASVSTSNLAPQGMAYIDPAWYQLDGLTTQYRVCMAFASNATAIARTITASVYELTASAGGADALTPTWGAALGSSASLASPAASTLANNAGTPFTALSARYLALGMVLSGSPAADHVSDLSVCLQVRNV